MRGKIFISYRRQDAKADARSIYQRLERTFGAKRLFMDVDTIQRGADFRHVLDRHLAESTVLLALIGPGWMNADTDGRRRLDDPADFVRMEIATALKRGISVVPILLEGARMPDATDLPDDVKDLVYRQAARVSHDNFPRDMDSIERDLKRLVGSQRSSVLPLAAGIAGALALAGAAALYQWADSSPGLRPETAKVEPAARTPPGPVAAVSPQETTPPPRQPPIAAAPRPQPPQVSTPAAPSPVTGRLTTATAVRAEEYRIIRNLSVEACTAECERDQRCRMFSHWHAATCYLFDKTFETYPTAASVTGTVAVRAR